MMRAVLVVAALSGVARVVSSSGPEQVHLAYTGARGELSVDFVMNSSAYGSARWGPTNSSWTGFANSTSFLYPEIGYMHQALMQFGEGAENGARFWYQVGSDASGWSEPFPVTPSPARPEVFAVFGDFGLANDVCLNALVADASAGVFDSVLHVGDFAYDFQSDRSSTGNVFMNLIQPYAAIKPVMPAVGNHEDCGECPGVAEVPDSYSNFSQYKVRFHSVSLYAGANSGSRNNIYYSFDRGLTHFVVFSAEAYIYAQNATFIANQLAFLKADLASVNRTETPWVVGLAHKNWRMAEEAFDDFAPILQAGGVDFLFCGHYHYYARTLPYDSATNQTDVNATNADFTVYTNPSYMTIVVTGASGDREKESPCEGHDSAPVVQCSRNYGYGFFTALNRTHATWTFKSISPYGHGPKNYTDLLTVVHTDRG